MTANELPIIIAYVAFGIIPDTCSLALPLLDLLHFFLIDGSASALADIAAAAGTFALLVMLCMAGQFGGGDANLIAASTFFS
jgi:prepilin peptidase CpaA